MTHKMVEKKEGKSLPLNDRVEETE